MDFDLEIRKNTYSDIEKRENTDFDVEICKNTDSDVEKLKNIDFNDLYMKIWILT